MVARNQLFGQFKSIKQRTATILYELMVASVGLKIR
jgi:hypothetical protein